MSENPPELIPSSTEVVPAAKKSQQENIEHINTVIAAGIDNFNAEQEKTAQEERLRQEAHDIMGRNLDNAKEKNKPTIEVPTSVKQDHITGLKRLGLAVAVTFASLLPAKEAKAQQNMHSDKEGIKKEYKYTRDTLLTEAEMVDYKQAFNNLSEKNKEDWNAYVEHLKSLKLSGSPSLNSKSFSKQIMDDWIAHNPGTTLTEGLVSDIQKGLIYYEESIDKLEREAEAHGKTLASGAKDGDKGITFMQALKHTKIDGHVGQFTSTQEFAHHFVTTTQKTYANVKIPNEHLIEMSSKKTKLEDKGFATPGVAQNLDK